MSVQMNLRQHNRGADIGRGLAALVGVVLLVVAVPAALLTWVGSPLPAAVPTLSEVASALRDTYIPDEFLLKVLALVCWLAWIELVASLLVEAYAYARGRKAGSVPLAGGLQRSAARLVATVALLGLVLATRGGSEPGDRAGQPLVPLAEPVVTLVIDESAPANPQAGPVAGADEAAAPTYEVQRRDTLWDIAERHLGDPLRWQEIFRLNEGCPQADGRCLADPDLIFAGWQLQLPADASGLAPPPDPAPAPDEAPPSETAPADAGRTSGVIDGGMVLIDDGGTDGAEGDVLVVSDPAPGGARDGTVPRDGMVLLPGSGGVVLGDEPAVLAAGRQGAGDTRADDEMAAGHGRPHDAPVRPATDE